MTSAAFSFAANFSVSVVPVNISLQIPVEFSEANNYPGTYIQVLKALYLAITKPELTSVVELRLLAGCLDTWLLTLRASAEESIN